MTLRSGRPEAGDQGQGFYSSVLVALDGSEGATAAIPHALAIARRFSATLFLLRVLPETGNAWAARDYDAQRSQAEGYLESLRRSLGDEGLEVDCVIGRGDPAAVILETARALGRPLIVLTTSGWSAASTDGAVGQVADGVLQKASSPVVLVRQAPARPERRDARR